MNPIELTNMQHQARRRYELARLRLGLRSWLLILPVALLAFALTERNHAPLILGSALAFVALTFLWYGRDLGRGTWPGLFAGLVPLSLSMLSYRTGFCCGGFNCEQSCFLVCVAGGILGGALLGYTAAGRYKDQNNELLISVVLASAMGALGCWMLGVWTLLGMTGAMALGASAIRLLRRIQPT